MGWFKRWSNLDSARSLGEWIAWAILGLCGTTLAAVMAAAAAYTHWYWDAYGPVGVAFAFVVSVVALSLCALITGGAVLLAAIARNTQSKNLSTTEQIFDEIIDKDGGRNANADVDHLSQIMRDLSERVESLSASIEQIERRSPSNDQLHSLSNHIESERAARKRDVDGISKSISGLRNGESHIQKELQAFRERVQSVFHAKRVLSSYESLYGNIELVSAKMADPLSKSEEYPNWQAWIRDLNILKSMLRGMCNVVAPFQDIQADMFDTPGEDYREDKWKFDFSGMTETQKHDYKTYRILHRNFTRACETAGAKIRQAASAIP